MHRFFGKQCNASSVRFRVLASGFLTKWMIFLFMLSHSHRKLTSRYRMLYRKRCRAECSRLSCTIQSYLSNLTCGRSLKGDWNRANGVDFIR